MRKPREKRYLKYGEYTLEMRAERVIGEWAGSNPGGPFSLADLKGVVAFAYDRGYTSGLQSGRNRTLRAYDLERRKRRYRLCRHGRRESLGNCPQCEKEYKDETSG